MENAGCGASTPLTTAAAHPCTPPQPYGAVNHVREATNGVPDIETRLPSNSHEGYSNCTRMRDQFKLLRLSSVKRHDPQSALLYLQHVKLYKGTAARVSMHAFQSVRLQAPAALLLDSPEYEAV
jgi:hypothetical protein